MNLQRHMVSIHVFGWKLCYLANCVAMRLGLPGELYLTHCWETVEQHCEGCNHHVVKPMRVSDISNLCLRRLCVPSEGRSHGTYGRSHSRPRNQSWPGLTSQLSAMAETQMRHGRTKSSMDPEEQRSAWPSDSNHRAIRLAGNPMHWVAQAQAMYLRDCARELHGSARLGRYQPSYGGIECRCGATSRGRTGHLRTIRRDGTRNHGEKSNQG